MSVGVKIFRQLAKKLKAYHFITPLIQIDLVNTYPITYRKCGERKNYTDLHIQYIDLSLLSKIDKNEHEVLGTHNNQTV